MKFEPEPDAQNRRRMPMLFVDYQVDGADRQEGNGCLSLQFACETGISRVVFCWRVAGGDDGAARSSRA